MGYGADWPSQKERRLASFVGSGALGTVYIAGHPAGVENQVKTLVFQRLGGTEAIGSRLVPRFLR